MLKKLATSLLAVTAGCATSESDGGLRIEGQLLDVADVTHVVAASPQSGKRIVVEPESDGRFALALDLDAQWVVTFADWTKLGKDMQVATLQANSLDAFVAHHATTLDLGSIEVVNGRAYGSLEYGELLAALGLDRETAARMGRSDNLALRYANPDIDNDGTIDGLQHGHDFRLDIAGAFTLTTNGREATVGDLVAGTWNQPGIRYKATTIQAAVPRAMGMNMASGTLVFEEPFFGTALGAETPMVAPGTTIGAPHVKLGEREGMPMIGVVAHGTHDTPTGAYEIRFANGQLTFSDVHAPSAAQLESGKDFAVPFVQIRPTVTGCTVDCDIAGIDLDWRRMTASGWQAASEPQAARIEIAAKLNGKNTYLAANLDAGTTSIEWSEMPVWNTGILQSELAYLGTSEICYVAVSFPSQLGMKMTTSATNPACY